LISKITLFLVSDSRSRLLRNKDDNIELIIWNLLRNKYPHSKNDIDKVVSVFEKIFENIGEQNNDS